MRIVYAFLLVTLAALLVGAAISTEFFPGRIPLTEKFLNDQKKVLVPQVQSLDPFLKHGQESPYGKK
ncbi:MAG: hypothetical protein JNM27_18925 [Leptospirales bacterium]|nr:hypothetical protein [Leptospirales bacterium]